jgi:ribosomal protein L37AE/L43A
MHGNLQVAIAAITTIGAGWLMLTAGVEKNVLERRRQRPVCPSCGRHMHERVCANCAG